MRAAAHQYQLIRPEKPGNRLFHASQELGTEPQSFFSSECKQAHARQRIRLLLLPQTCPDNPSCLHEILSQVDIPVHLTSIDPTTTVRLARMATHLHCLEDSRSAQKHPARLQISFQTYRC